jgi:hypothetical protein
MENLDLACAKLGDELGSIEGLDEKTLTAALSVLEEQGVYACFLYLNARGGNAGRRVCEKLAGFLRDLPTGDSLLADGGLYEALQQLAKDLDNLLFARDLLRQALVYGRYHLKARNGA